MRHFSEFFKEPFALFSSPDYQCGKMICYSLVREKGASHPPSLYSPNFFEMNSDRHFFSILSQHIIDLKEFEDHLQTLRPSPLQESFTYSLSTEKSFKENIKDIQALIQKSPLRKAVPYAFANASRSFALKKSELAYMILAAMKEQQLNRGILFGLFEEERGILGLTPEILLQKKSESFETMALAGTILSMPGASEKLLNDPKEKAEHEWVIKGIVKELSEIGITQLGEIRTKKSGRLTHLETPISILNPSKPFGEIVQKLHPTPALGGYPRSEANDWLKKQEVFLPRSRFGAPFSINTSDLEIAIVAIRCLEWSKLEGFIRIGAGCGIVAESVLEKEWMEIQNKWASITQSLGLKNVEPRG